MPQQDCAARNHDKEPDRLTTYPSRHQPPLHVPTTADGQHTQGTTTLTYKLLIINLLTNKQMKKITFFKTLLVAAGLLGGSNAWAEVDYNVELVNLDFSTDASVSTNWTTGNGMALAKTLLSGENYYCTMSFGNSGNAASSAEYNFPNLSSYQAYKISFLWGMYSSLVHQVILRQQEVLQDNLRV